MHEVSKSIEPDLDVAWQQTIGRIEDCWQGNVEEVIGILKSKQVALGMPPDNAEVSDARKLVADTIGYLTNNAARMNYPLYRQAGYRRPV